MRIVLPEALRELAGGRAVVEVAAGARAGAGGIRESVADVRRTVGGVLDSLRASHPGIYDRLVTEQGRLRPHVNLFVDGENIRFTGGLETGVAERSEIFVLPAISGG